MNPNQVLKLPPNLIWRVLDDGAVLVTPDDGKVTVLNGVGTYIWQLVDGQRTISDILTAIVETYDIDKKQAQDDLDKFVAELTGRYLLLVDNAVA